MDYRDIHAARNKAEEDIRQADMATRHAASLIAGRLRIANVSYSVLKMLKRELKSYNIQTGVWSDK